MKGYPAPSKETARTTKATSPIDCFIVSLEVMTDFFQVEVSLGSAPTLEQRTSEAIKASVDEARAYVKKQPVLHLDETGWREANQK